MVLLILTGSQLSRPPFLLIFKLIAENSSSFFRSWEAVDLAFLTNKGLLFGMRRFIFFIENHRYNEKNYWYSKNYVEPYSRVKILSN